MQIKRLTQNTNISLSQQTSSTPVVPVKCQITTLFGQIHQNAAQGAKFAFYNCLVHIRISIVNRMFPYLMILTQMAF